MNYFPEDYFCTGYWYEEYWFGSIISRLVEMIAKVYEAVFSTEYIANV